MPSPTPSWTLRVAQTLDEAELRRPPIVTGADAPRGSADFYVLADDPRPLRFDLHYLPEDYRFRTEAVAWHGWFAFGFGGRLVMVSDDLRRRIEIALGCYFEAFTPHDDDVLLVLSGQGIVCVLPDGTVKWRNDTLGLDGVIVHDIEDGIVAGDGEWDPPGGWRPFRISLATGKPLS